MYSITTTLLQDATELVNHLQANPSVGEAKQGLLLDYLQLSLQLAKHELVTQADKEKLLAIWPESLTCFLTWRLFEPLPNLLEPMLAYAKAQSLTRLQSSLLKIKQQYLEHKSNVVACKLPIIEETQNFAPLAFMDACELIQSGQTRLSLLEDEAEQQLEQHNLARIAAKFIYQVVASSLTQSLAAATEKTRASVHEAWYQLTKQLQQVGYIIAAWRIAVALYTQAQLDKPITESLLVLLNELSAQLSQRDVKVTAWADESRLVQQKLMADYLAMLPNEFMTECSKLDGIRVAQLHYNQHIQRWQGMMIVQCAALLGPAPCDYAVVGLTGPSPSYGLLVSGKVTTAWGDGSALEPTADYFKRLYQLVAFKQLCQEESLPLPPLPRSRLVPYFLAGLDAIVATYQQQFQQMLLKPESKAWIQAYLKQQALASYPDFALAPSMVKDEWQQVLVWLQDYLLQQVEALALSYQVSIDTLAVMLEGLSIQGLDKVIVDYLRQAQGFILQWQLRGHQTTGETIQLSNDELAIAKRLQNILLPALAAAEQALQAGTPLAAYNDAFWQALFNALPSQADDLLAAIWDAEKQDFKSSTLLGNHQVYALTLPGLPALHLKLYPDFPGIEYAIYQLHQQLMQGGITPSRLLKLSQNGKCYPVLVSKTIVSESLHNVLKTKPETLTLLDHYQYSLQVLCSLLVNFEDAKPDNWMLEVFPTQEGMHYRLVGIDNDHAFVLPMVKKSLRQGFGYKFMVKNSLFCLDAMQQPLHPQAIQGFCQLDIGQTLMDWLLAVEHQDRHYRELFAEEIDKLTKRPEPTYIATLLRADGISPGLMATIHDKLVKLQQLFKENPEATGLEALLLTEPLLGREYAKVLKQEKTAYQRFIDLFKQEYVFTQEGHQQTVVNSQAVLKSALLAIPTEQDISQHTVAEALNRLELITYQHSMWAHLMEQVIAGQLEAFRLLTPAEQSRLLSEVDFSLFKPAIQRQLFALLAQGQHVKLCLRNAKALTDGDLAKILKDSASLQYLDISSCEQLTDKALQAIVQYTPQIRTLLANDLPRISYAGYWELGLQGTYRTVLPELRELQLNNTGLQQLILQAPKLYRLSLRNNSKLSLVDTQSIQLYALDLTGCEMLDIENLTRLAKKTLALQQLALPQAVPAYLSTFLCLYPSLLQYGWLHYPQVTVKELQQELDKVVTALNLPSPLQKIWLGPLVLNRLRQHLQVSQNSQVVSKLKKIIRELFQIDDIKIEAIFVLFRLQHITPKLIKSLINNFIYDNKHAAEALGQLQHVTSEVLTDLIAALKNKAKHSKTRQAVAKILGQLKQITPEVITALVACLEEDYADVRQAAAQTLGQLQQVTPEVIAVLVVSLEDDNISVRQAAAQALIQLQHVTPEAIAALVSCLKDRYYCKEAAQALAHLPNNKSEIIDVLIAKLANEDINFRQMIIRTLGLLRQLTPEVESTLIMGLNDEYLIVCQAAAQSFIQLQHSRQGKIIPFMTMLKNRDWRIRQAAVQALGELQSITSEVIAGLVDSLDDKESDICIAAILALGLHQQHITPEIIAVLIEKLQSNDANIRLNVAYLLAKLQRIPPEGIAALVACLMDKHLSICLAAARALVQFQHFTSQVVAELILRLKVEDKNDQLAVVQALTELQLVTPEIVTILITSLMDEVWGTRHAAIQAFGYLRQSFPELITELVASLVDSKRQYQQHAVGGEGNMYQLSPEIIDAVINGLKNDYFLKYAIQALDKLQHNTPQVTTMLVANLTHADWHNRRDAARALGNLQHVTPEIIDGLLITLKDDNREVREAAAHALAALGSIASFIDYLKSISQQTVEVFKLLLHMAPALPAPLTPVSKANTYEFAKLIHRYFKDMCQVAVFASLPSAEELQVYMIEPRTSPLIIFTQVQFQQWASIVLLPNHYTILERTYQSWQLRLFYLDSSQSNAKLPTDLLTVFRQAYPDLRLYDGITFHQQISIEDSGWWALYNALQIVLTGNIAFLKQFTSPQPAHALRALWPELAESLEVKAKSIAAAEAPVVPSTVQTSKPEAKYLAPQPCHLWLTSEQANTESLQWLSVLWPELIQSRDKPVRLSAAQRYGLFASTRESAPEGETKVKAIFIAPQGQSYVSEVMPCGAKPNYVVTPTTWYVSLCRKPSGRVPEHAFILVEGRDKDGCGFIWRFDLTNPKGTPLAEICISQHYQRLLPAQYQAAFKEALHQETIAIGGCWRISPEQGQALLAEVKRDALHPPYYLLLGNKSLAGKFISREGHNCFTWAREKINNLKDSRIKIPVKWTDAFAAKTSWYVVDEQAKSHCLVM